MSVHSKQLGLLNNGAAGSHTLYTVPTGYRTIVKNLTVYNHGAATNRVVVEVDVSAVITILAVILCGAAGSATETQQFNTWIVLDAGSALKVAPQSAAADVVVSGAELQL